MEEDVVPVTEDEDSFYPEDLLGDPARHEISQTSLEIMQLLAECEGGQEVFGNIHTGNFIYDSASLVGSSSELSDIFQDDSQIDINAVHRLDDILVNSIDSLNKLSPKKKTSLCQEDSPEKKKPRNSKEKLNKEMSEKSSKSKINSLRRKRDSKGDTRSIKKQSVKVSISSSPSNVEARKQPSCDVGSIPSSPEITSSLNYEKNSKYKIGEDGMYTCCTCGKKFSVLKSLQIHSTIHRQKVRLVRKSQSKDDSEKHRSERKSSTSTIKNTPRRYNAKLLHSGVVQSGITKPAVSVCGYGMSPECQRLELDLNRYNMCSKTSLINGVCRETKGKFSDIKSLKCSGVSDFSSIRKGNKSCSKTLESLSRHGAKEYLTLSSKKSKESCRTKTIPIKSGDNHDVVKTSSPMKIADRQKSKYQKKSMIPKIQSSGAKCNVTRKRNASKRCSGEKQPMKRVCLLDRFRDDQSSESSDSVHLCTVDTDPNTNGGLLQYFDFNSSPKGSKKGGRTRVRIRRGQLVRKTTADTNKLSTCESGDVFMGTGTGGDTRPKKGCVIDDSSGREISASTGNSSVISSSRGEATGCNTFDQNQCKKITTSQSTNTISVPSSTLDSNLNLNCGELVNQKERKCHPGNPQHVDQMNSDNEGSKGDSALKLNPEADSTKRETILPTTTTGVLLQECSNNEESAHHSTGTGREGEALNCEMEDPDFSTNVKNQIPVTRNSIVDLKSKEKDEDVSFTDKKKLERERTSCSNSKVRRNNSPHNENSEVRIGVNTVPSCESQCLVLCNDNSEECYDCDRENVSDFNPSDSSDDDSEPLVLYQQSCRTLPLCALLNLVKRQKLVRDLSRNSHTAVIEKPVKSPSFPSMTKCAQLSAVESEKEDKKMCCDDNDLSAKTKNVSSFSWEIKDMLPPKMPELMSSCVKEIITTEIPVNLSNTDLPNDNYIEIRGVSEHYFVDPKKSLGGSELASISAKQQTSDKMPCSPGIFNMRHSSYHDSCVSPSTVHVESSSRLENRACALAPCGEEQQGASFNNHWRDKSDHHGNNLHLTSDTNHNNLLPLTELVQCDGEQQEASLKKLCKEKSNHRGSCLPQTLDTNQDDLLSLTETVQCNMSVGPYVRGPCVRGPCLRGPGVRGPGVRGLCVRVEVCDKETQSKIRPNSNSDEQRSPKLSTSTDCTLSSLKSIDDDNCIEVSRCVIRRFSTDSEGDGEDISVNAVTRERAGENTNSDILNRSHPDVNVVKSDGFVHDSVNRCLGESSLDSVSHKCLDNGSVSLEKIKSLNYHKDDNYNSSITSSRDPDVGTNVCFLKDSKLGFKPYQIGVQPNLPRNVMSTCNFLGTFADDMVTGMINVIDTETNSSDSSSVWSKFHDYCARQISYQNFIQWKLDENLNNELSQDNSICARMLSYQASNRTKSEKLLLSEKQFEGIPQREHPEFTGKGEQPEDPKSREQPEVTRSGEQPVLDITVPRQRGKFLTTESDGADSDNVGGDIGGVCATIEGDCTTIEGKCSTSEGNFATSEGKCATSEDNCATCEDNFATNEGISIKSDSDGKSEGVCTFSEGTWTDRDCVCATNEGISITSEGISVVGNESSLYSEDNRNISRSITPTVVSTGQNQNVSSVSGTELSEVNTPLYKDQQLDYGYLVNNVIPDNTRDLVPLCSEVSSSDRGESTEDECDNHVYTKQTDTCARVLPFETNIMHKFSEKTKLLFQEYHDRQQNAMDISDSDTAEKGSRLDIQTQTVSSLEESECSVYEMHMLGSVSSISANSNSTFNQNDFKRNPGNEKSHLSFNQTFSAQKLRNTKETDCVNPRGIDDSGDSGREGLTLKSDMVPFKSSMNIYNLEDISTSLLNRENIVLSKEEERYLKSPKKLWYRNYMGSISTSEEGRGDNLKTNYETSSHQKAFVFPELCDSEQHDDTGDESSRCVYHNSATVGKENTPKINKGEDTRESTELVDFNGEFCEEVVQNGEESRTLNLSVRQSDEECASDTTTSTSRFDVCSRMRQFRKRRSCARACRDGYLSGCARSRVFVKKTYDKS